MGNIEEDIKYFSNYFKLRLSPSNDNINSLKDYGDFAEENKQYDSSDSQHGDTQPNHATSQSELQKEDSSSLSIKLTFLRYKSSIIHQGIK